MASLQFGCVITMDNNVYIPLSRQVALFRDMATTANNLANVNTTGYNSNHIIFESYLKNVDGPRGKLAFTQDISSFRNTQQGSIRSTGNTLDLAIGSEGYFVVDTPLGTRYTRAGNFQLDALGTLVTQEGYPVLDVNGQPVTFTDEDREITVGGIGNISVDGEDRATLSVVTFDQPQLLERAGDRMYIAEETAPQPAENPRVMQGALENSNVQPVMEMTHMIEISRAVGSTAKFIETMYDLQRKTNSTWTQQG